MTSRSNILMVFAALTVGATACSDDPTEPEDALTEEEAISLLNAYRGLVATENPEFIEETPTGGIIGCPLGGTAEVNLLGGGDEEFAGDTVRLTLDVSINPMNCRIAAAGAEYVVTGDPRVREQFRMQVVGVFESIEVTGSTVGALAWEHGDRSGSCEMDLALTAEPNFMDPVNPVDATLTGMLCGHQVTIDGAALPFVD
ncbi:MAG: hypothetical protein F4187_08165 [Gemmatimonadetes bacterium]|nr:hypothetical protein [Gemmatimonadota bacterium]